MKRLAFSILAALMVPLAFWIGGMEIDQRGVAQVHAFILALLVGGVTYSFPGWDDK
jgi:hypothetical protein